MKRVICLYRVSTKGQVDKDDIPMQRIECRKFIEAQGWTLVGEYADKGVTFNGVAPSMTETRFLESLAGLTVEMSAKAHPLGRNARPDDIAPTVLHLLDDKNEYTSGAVIPITGGSQY